MMKRAPQRRAWTDRERRLFDRREARASDRLPFVRHLDPATILARDGSVLQCMHIRGLPFETRDASDLDYRREVRDTMVRGLTGGRFALWHHIVRREVRPEVIGTFPDPFAAVLDRAWRARLSKRRLFVNDLFLTLVRRPARRGAGLVEGLFNPAPVEDEAGRARDRRELDAAREGLLAALEPCGARLLTTYATAEGWHSEPMEFLSALYNGDMAPVRLAEGAIGPSLTRRRVSFGSDTFELGPLPGHGPSFGAMLSLKEYPPHTLAGQLDALLGLPHEFILTQSFSLVDRQVALDRIGLVLRRMRAADDDALSLRRDLTVAKDDVSAGRSAFGEHHITLAVRAADKAALDEAVADVRAAFTELGAIVVREDVALEPSFWAQFPGAFADIPRKALLSSGNFAGLASLHNHALGRADGNHWGPAVTVLETTAASPYFFSFHNGDLGNFLVIGPSGSGKTVVVNFLLAQARKFDPRIVFFDKDRGAEIFLRAMGARYEVLQPGTPTGFNPLHLPDTAVNRRFLQALTARLVTAPGETLAADDHALIADAVAANFDQAPEYRRLRYFRELFAGARRPTLGDLASRLAPWVEGGDRAWLFDNPNDGLDLETRTAGFDMTRILDDPILRTPAMMYLFHRVEERLDGTPSIIVVDEGWKALDDEVFVARIRDWEKTIRKRNGILGFATQSAADALESEIASAIIEQSATQIFLPNPKAQERDYRTGFGLTAHEFELVRSLPDTSRCFLVRSGRDSVVVRMNLNGMPDLLTVLSGRESTVRILDEVRAEVGDSPGDWLPRLLARARA